MGSYYHVLPVNGGLFVPAANMSNLIADINEYFEDNENFDLRLDPTDWVKAMDTLRDNLFYKELRDIAGNWANFQDYLRR